MTISTNKAERLALIKKIAERRTKMANVKRKTRALKPQIKKSKNLTNMPLPKETNIYQWTDASRYAKEYYGETMYETTRYDNDWD
jgi:hypothetical protein|tara:strand:+ start:1181 stop:1435 length:255 start_codon:yes stop_codon:yes gene_type:complete